MDLNTDFDAVAVVHAAQQPWQSSPIQGVRRRLLDRIGDEVARATTIVDYAPGSQFSPHVHTGGEEFLVLDGVFQDEHGDFPAGSYIRNPPQSSHTPGSEPGCQIFVKLWQFDPADRKSLRIDTTARTYVPHATKAGVEVMPLYADSREDVRMERYAPGATVTIGDAGGFELLVTSGGFSALDDQFSAQSWLRLPRGHQVTLTTGPDGAVLWVKSGHLKTTPTAPKTN